MAKSNNEKVQEIVGLFNGSLDDINRAFDFALTAMSTQLEKLHIDHNDVQDLKEIFRAQASNAMALISLGDYSNADAEEVSELASQIKAEVKAVKKATGLCRIVSKGFFAWLRNDLDEDDERRRRAKAEQEARDKMARRTMENVFERFQDKGRDA